MNIDFIYIGLLMPLSSLPPSPTSIQDAPKRPVIQAPESTTNQVASTPALTPISTPQSRQVTLLSSASYTVSLNNNNASYTYSNSVSIESSQTLPSTSINDVEKIEAPKALLDGSKNILKFIEQRLASEQVSGSTSEELQELLEQGLSGFKQGFSEAEAILGNATESVSAAINQLYSEVIEGFNALTKQYVASNDGQRDEATNVAQNLDVPIRIIQASSNPQVNGSSERSTGLSQVSSQIGSKTANQNSTDILGADRLTSLSNIIDSINGDATEIAQENKKSSLGSENTVSASIDYRKQNLFTLELVTLDGDKVSIQANSTLAYNNTVGFNQSADQASQLQSTSSSAQFGFSVDGELDEQEVIEIQSILDQVLSLSDEFYNGDVSEAFEKVLALDFNQKEITGFAINLRQTEQFSVAAAYQTTSPVLSSQNSASQNKIPELSQLDAVTREAFLAIGDFVSRVLEELNQQPSNNSNLFDVAELFLNLAEQLDEKNNQVTPDSHRSSFSDTVNSLIG